jgi:hypothetical protein
VCRTDAVRAGLGVARPGSLIPYVTAMALPWCWSPGRRVARPRYLIVRRDGDGEADAERGGPTCRPGDSCPSPRWNG